MKKRIGVVALALCALMSSAVGADPLSGLLKLHADMERMETQPDFRGPGAQEQGAVFEGLLTSPEHLDDSLQIVDQLNPALRKNLEQAIRFGIAHERRSDWEEHLTRFGQVRADRATLSTDNMLFIPLRPGKLEISFLFVKKYGSILRCDRERFQATLDTATVDVVPDPKQPGRVIARFAGTDPNGQPLPAQPVGGIIKSDGKTAEILGDDGSWVKVMYQGGEKYKFSSNKLPVTVNAKYIQ